MYSPQKLINPLKIKPTNYTTEFEISNVTSIKLGKVSLTLVIGSVKNNRPVTALAVVATNDLTNIDI